MADLPKPAAHPDSRGRVLDIAEAMFMESGYRSVRLADVAKELGVKTASLYYHAPGGKQDLYALVLERSLERHREGLNAAIAKAAPKLESQLTAVAEWMHRQPRMNVTRVADELACLDEEVRDRVRNLSFACLFVPLRGLFLQAQERGESRDEDPDLLVGAFLSLLDSVRVAADNQFTERPVLESTKRLIGIVVRGLAP